MSTKQTPKHTGGERDREATSRNRQPENVSAVDANGDARADETDPQDSDRRGHKKSERGSTRPHEGTAIYGRD